jgi:MFS family permease
MSRESSALRVALTGAVTLALAMGIGRFAFTPILPMMRDDGLLTVSEGGLLASAHFFGYLMGAVSAPWLPVAPRRLMQLSLLVIAASTLLMAVDVGPGAWLVLRWSAGLCSAWVLVLVGNHVVQHLVARGDAGLRSWLFAGVGAGIAIAGLAVLVLTVFEQTSAAAWWIFGVAALFVAVVLSLCIGDELPAHARPRASPRCRRATPDWTLTTAYGAAGLGYIIPATYLPVMAREMVSSPWIFGAVWPVFGAAAFVSTLIAAPLHRRFSNRTVWSAAQLVMAAGLLLPVLAPHVLSIGLAGLCVGGTFMIITMAGISEAHRTAPPDAVMTHIAGLTAAFAAGQMIGPGLAGLIYEITGTFAPALWMTGVALAATAVLLVLRPARSTVPLV